MKRKSPKDKLEQKRTAWLARTMKVLDANEGETQRLLSSPRKQSIRINTLLAESGLDFPGKNEQYSWMKDGYTTDSTQEVRDSEFVANGKLFIQNAASWLPVIVLDPQPEEYILDVCAAPGGKTSHIAAITDNKAHIYANDNSRARLAKLQANMKRLSASVEQYTLYDATAIARKLEGRQFDKILLDAPCSGEGLMNFNNDADFATWSVAHIKRLQQLQKRIITQSWQLLKPGGTLVYSTCTMAPEENEAVVDYLLRTRADAQIEPFELELPNRVKAVEAWNGKRFSTETQKCLRLKPSENIEAFFVCKLKKLAQ